MQPRACACPFHTECFVDGQHLVEARNIRFANSPCFLMSVLKDVSTHSKELPFLAGWMHKAHQILSYPASQEEYGADFSAGQLQKLVNEVRQSSRDLRRLASDETLIVDGVQKTPAKRIKERSQLVQSNESQRIFPGLAAFLHTLKYGLSLPRHNHLNSNHSD